MDGYDDVGIQLRVTRAQARQFAEGLKQDEFRQRLEEDPRTVLAEYGIEIPPDLLPDRVQLPEPGDLEELLGQIPGGQGFRAEADEFFIHPVMILLFALAFLGEEPGYV